MKTTRRPAFEWSVVIAAAAILALYVSATGRRGVYFFDTSINYNMGWLIYNGRKPYIDFPMPLMPLSGILTALSFALFGIRYLASVYMAAILSGAGVLVCFGALRRILPWCYAAFFSVTLNAVAIPLVGTLYYNHLTVALAGMTICLLLARMAEGIAGRASGGYALIYAAGAVVTLSKFHVGALILGAVFAMHAWEILARPKFSIVSAIRELAISLIPALAIGLGFWIWLRCSPRLILENLLGTASPRLSLHAIKDFFFGSLDIRAQPELNGVLLVAAVGAVAFFMARRGWLKGAALRFVALAAMLLGCALFLALTSEESPSCNDAFYLLSLIALGLALDQAPKEQFEQGMQVAWAGMTIPFTAFLLFSVSYTIEGSRRSYDELKGAYVPYKRSDLTFSSWESLPFFQGVSMRPAEVWQIQAMLSLIAQKPNAKVFFGPELEMLYAATGQLPARGWPLWIHQGVSVKDSEYPGFEAAFNQQDYDLVFLSMRRRSHTPFIEADLSKRYKKGDWNDPRAWVTYWIKQ